MTNWGGYTVSYYLEGTSGTTETTALTSKIDIKGLEPEKTYKLRVKTNSSEGEEYDSDWSGEVSATTVKISYTAVPENLRVVAKTLNSITIAWDESANASSYIVAFKTATDADFREKETALTEYLFPDLEQDTEIVFKVKARPQSGSDFDSEFTAEMTASTLSRSAGINTVEDMMLFVTEVNAGATDGGGWKNSSGVVELNSDLDMEGVMWIPVEEFSGVFDGNGKAISNLVVSSSASHVGMFQTLSGTIRNLTLEDNCGFTSTSTDRLSTAGAFAGEMSAGAEIINCTNKAAVSGAHNSGGIAGRSIAKTDPVAVISNCVNYGHIDFPETTSPGGEVCVGGIIARTEKDVRIEHCTNHGEISVKTTVSQNNMIGGIAGRSIETIFEGCQNSDKAVVRMSSTHYGDGCVGGILGYDQWGTFISCENHGRIVADGIADPSANCEVKIGGIIGSSQSNSGETSGLVSGCSNHTDISIVSRSANKGSTLGGIIGMAYNVRALTVENCTNTGNMTLTCTKGESNIGGIVGRMHPATLTPDVASSIENCRNSGSITADVNDPADSPKFNIGGITGILNHNVSFMLNCENSGEITSYMSNQTMAGGIASESKGDVIGCTNSGRVLAAGRHNNNFAAVGGIVAQVFGVDGTEISNCVNSGPVIYYGFGGTNAADDKIVGIGGIVGRQDKGIIEGCTNTGPVLDYEMKGTAGNLTMRGAVGSICGWAAMSSQTTIRNCVIGGSLGDCDPEASDYGVGASTSLTADDYENFVYGKAVLSVSVSNNTFK